ncbi:MAG: hypothetical protein ACW96U_00060 [Candidatus Heimdallarchaeaceae archaeon]|jgi:hypothetical protein
MIYEMDEVERPSDKIINDDEKFDAWHRSWRDGVRKKLMKYHKDMKTPGVDHGIPRPQKGYIFGNENDKSKD